MNPPIRQLIHGLLDLRPTTYYTFDALCVKCGRKQQYVMTTQPAQAEYAVVCADCSRGDTPEPKP